MSEFLLIAHLTLILFTLSVIVLLLMVLRKGKKNIAKEETGGLMEPPQPRKLPLIGHLHLLAGYEVPYQAFATLRKKYGDVVELKLGNVPSLVVSGHKNIKEILITKGHHFDSRPNFERYRMLFSGDKENSLAFCDWSDRHKFKRDMLKIHTFPRAFTNEFNSLENIIGNEAHLLVSRIEGTVKIKATLLETVANIFTEHFCSKTFDESADFTRMVRNFDEIFYEVNQGYAADFLPFLLPFHTSHLEKINALARDIRAFVLEHVIDDRYASFCVDDEPKDYVESLIKQVKYGSGPKISWDGALFALEDIIGGHCAIANFLIKLLAYIVNESEVQRRIQEEIDSITYLGDNSWRSVRISDRNAMPYTEGVVFEAVRMIASAIVPRVSNQDSSVNGFKIKKDTLIFLDNYDLSMSEELWCEPRRFKPERFLVNNRFAKPEHFLPFGGGRRGCMGYKMVQLVSFGLLGALMQHFTILPVKFEDYKVPVGSLALPIDTFSFNFARRPINVVT